MKTKTFSFVVLTVVLIITSAACSPTPVHTPTPLAAEVPGGAVEISGTFTYTNTIIVNTYYVENSVALADMHGFVVSDQKWVTLGNSQTLGYMHIHEKNMNDINDLDLTAVPEGKYNN